MQKGRTSGGGTHLATENVAQVGTAVVAQDLYAPAVRISLLLQGEQSQVWARQGA